ncbi:hypothetical protein RF11_07951 [Thelohanellus kitauei]|uniref:Uncharacterized protein n=1 Tax=Thelohanellus kitauei TaxID=669202 RepID=A0A0C2MW55_THEKT|nr:hypothetical protein RF11_07951 [Thelohanellus kitauei]
MGITFEALANPNKIRSIVKTAKENLLNAQKKNLLTYNQKFSSGTTFKVGDTILIKKPHSTSLDPIFSTPVEIVSVDPPVYTVKTSENKIFKIHHNRTKRYGTESEKIPTFDNYLESDSDDEHPNVEEKSNENLQQYPEKRTIKIPAQNLEYCKRYLPSFIKRGGMSEEALALEPRMRNSAAMSCCSRVRNGVCL